MNEHEAVRTRITAWGAERARAAVRAAERSGTYATDLLVPDLARMGVLGVCLPRRYGGLGLDYAALAVVSQALEAIDTTLRVVISVHVGLYSLGIFQWGTEEQRRALLPPAARGETLGAFCLTDVGAGSDPAAMASTARRTGDGYVLEGEKQWISLATRADRALWIARSNPERPDPHEQMSAFIVDLHAPGITRGDIDGKLGLRTMPTGWVRAEGVYVPADRRLGEEGEGFKIAMACLDNGRFTVGAGSVGLIGAALEASVAYAKMRTSFGREIGKQQLIQAKIAAMTRDHALGQLLVAEVARLKNAGLRNTRETSLLKWFATDAAFEAANAALQIHGAAGYSDGYDVERMLRNTRASQIYEGTNEIHQLIQAGYALGYRHDTALRCELPVFDREVWEAEA